MKILFAFFSLVSFISCDTFAVKKLGSCIVSEKHGGPYKIVSGKGNKLTVKDSKDSKMTFPNDHSWKQTSCPF